MQRDRTLFEEFKYQARHALPLSLVYLLTNWWPDNAIAVRVRGKLFSWFLGRCGRNFTVGRDVTLLDVDRLVIGDNVYLAKGTWLNAVGGVEIEDEVMFGPYVVLSSGKHCFKDGSARFSGFNMASVKVGRGTWLGAHVTVVAGVTIGKGNLVAANAVVARDTPDDVFVAGVPAKVIGPRIDETEEPEYSSF